MKKIKSNVGSFAQAKLQATMVKMLSILTIVAIIGFSFAACEDDDGGGSNGGGYVPTLVVPAITTTTTPNGLLENVYSQTLTATGSAPVTWSIESGTLPDGLTLSNAGVISGTPTTEGTSEFKIKATNSIGNDTKSFSITIGSNVFTNIGDLITCLEALPDNYFDSTPYNIKLNVSSLGGNAWKDGSVGNELGKIGYNKYISLDLSGSSFTSIEDYAFSNCNLASVTISDKVTSIGRQISLSLTSINVDTANTAYSSQDGVLYNKTKTTLVAYPARKTDTTFTIPNSVTSIEERAFNYCSNLTGITIPNSVTSIGYGAFQGCNSLTSVTIPAGVTSIGYYAFSSCSALTAISVDAANTAYSSDSGVLYNKDKTNLIQYPAEKTDTTFTIPASVTSIGDSAFSNCTSLTSVTIPASVTSIGDHPFSLCSALTAINVDAANTAYNSDSGVLYNKAKTSLLTYPGGKKGTTFTIPNGVTSIGNLAFYNKNLTSVTIPASVTSIVNQAFFGCDKLTSVTFATGSNITDDNFGPAFPEGEYGNTGSSLKTAYSKGKAGTYTRAAGGDTWTKM